MIKRSRCVTRDGKVIGIESIYEVNSEGKQINKKEELIKLRAMSRAGELLCDCGCQAELILVASDTMKTKQHFRIKNGTGKKTCTAVEESSHSVLCKIVLKCWMEDKIAGATVLSRVPASKFDGSDRKFEITLFEESRETAVCYWNERSNITREKIAEIEKILPGKVHYIVSGWNAGSDGQYPEFLQKIQETQGYVAYLTIHEDDQDQMYNNARLEIKVQGQGRDQTWKEIPVISASLRNYSLTQEGVLCYAGKPVRESAAEALEHFLREEERQAHLEEKRAAEARAAYEAKADEIRKKMEEDERNKQEELATWNRMIDHMVEERRVSKEKIAEVCDPTDSQVSTPNHDQALDFENTKKPLYDREGIRIYKCRLCGKTGHEEVFPDRGFPSPGLGVCIECSRNGRLAEEQKERMKKEEQNRRKIRCPLCGADVVKRYGRGRWFWGCSRYPICKFSANHM